MAKQTRQDNHKDSEKIAEEPWTRQNDHKDFVSIVNSLERYETITKTSWEPQRASNETNQSQRLREDRIEPLVIQENIKDLWIIREDREDPQAIQNDPNHFEGSRRKWDKVNDMYDV